MDMITPQHTTPHIIFGGGDAVVVIVVAVFLLLEGVCISFADLILCNYYV